MFNSVGIANFELEVELEARPVLLACIRRGFDSKEQIKTLEAVSRDMDRDLKICLLYEGVSELYRTLKVEGTPTYLLYLDGEEIGRVLGKVLPETLVSFVADKLAQEKGMLDRVSFGRNPFIS